MNAPARTLAERVEARWRREGWPGSGARVLVALSGGLDSCVLLHLLRFRLQALALELVAAHFDHAMRPDSAGDARWVRGLTRAWRVPLREERSSRPLSGETEARRRRYEFLHRARREEDASLILTGHHADDQVETILFRIARGTGVRGLAGIWPRSSAGVCRPLLDESRADLETYADAVKLRTRVDPTNLELAASRNRIRLEVLPKLQEVHPGARRGILRLGRNARRMSRALDAFLEPALEDVLVERSEGRLTVARDGFLAYPSAVQGFLLRGLYRSTGLSLDERGTGEALEFIRYGQSGGRLHLPGAVRLVREFDLVHLRWGEDGSPDRGRIAGAEDVPFVLEEQAGEVASNGGRLPRGRGEARLLERRLGVIWGPEPPTEDGAGWIEVFDPARLHFPLTVRRWQPGDRIETAGGRKKLKKLFGELKVPLNERRRTPVVSDARGEVIWVPGRYRAPVALPRNDTWNWYLGIRDEDRHS